MVTIRAERSADSSAVRNVVTAAFGPEGDRVAILVGALNASGATVVSLVACGDSDADVVGHVQLNRSWVDAPRALVNVLVLSPLSVLPAWQRQGVGGSLIRAALNAARGLDAPAVFLEGDPAYYSRFGFERGSARGFEAPSTRIPDPAFQVYLLEAWETWMSGRLIYCDAFWSTDCVGLRDPSVHQSGPGGSDDRTGSGVGQSSGVASTRVSTD